MPCFLNVVPFLAFSALPFLKSGMNPAINALILIGTGLFNKSTVFQDWCMTNLPSFIDTRFNLVIFSVWVILESRFFINFIRLWNLMKELKVAWKQTNRENIVAIHGESKPKSYILLHWLLINSFRRFPVTLTSWNNRSVSELYSTRQNRNGKR